LAPVHIGVQRRCGAGFRAARHLVTSASLGWIHTIRAGASDAVPSEASQIPTSAVSCATSAPPTLTRRFVTAREVFSVFAVVRTAVRRLRHVR